MEELLFAIEPIFLEGKLSQSEVFILVFLCIALAVCVSYVRKPPKLRPPKEKKQCFPKVVYHEPGDPDFTLKTLESLKQTIAYFYRPEKTYAHTVHEIGTYLFDSDITSLAGKLEESIYLGKPLTEEENKEINTKIHTFIEKSRKDKM